MKTPPFKPEAKAFAEQLSAALQRIEAQLRTPMEPKTLLSLSEDSRPAELMVFFDEWAQGLAELLDIVVDALNDPETAQAFCQTLDTLFAKGIEYKRQLQHALISDDRLLLIRNPLLAKVSEQLSTSLQDFERLASSISDSQDKWVREEETFNLELNFTVVDTEELQFAIPKTTGEAIADALSFKSLFLGLLKGVAIFVILLTLIALLG